MERHLRCHRSVAAVDLSDRLKSVLSDRYTIERKLGGGGMADVYLTHDVRHNRKVVIKVMHRKLAELVGVERFLREIETTAKLQHPHILPLFDSGSVDDTVFYVMPYVEGESLRARLKTETQLPLADVLRITAQISSALDYAHRHGIVHRDIKPDNVLFHDGQALLADFGIALLRTDDEGHVRLTQSGFTLGTPQYMSPEQLGGKDVDPRSDIHALGVMAYEMLAGQPPFMAATITAVVHKVMLEEARPIGEHRRSVPPHVEVAIAKALEKLPADRWQTATEFADALTDPSPIGVRPPFSSMRIVLPWMVAATLALALGWVAVALNSRPGVPAPAVRFDVEFEPDMTPSFTPVVRLSPDGRQLFASAMVNRREEVIRHAFDRIGIGVVKGAGQGEQGTGNSRPFVSPDGRWVAYARQKALWKVPVEGGPAIKLGPGEWAGGSWGRNGRIVYTQAYDTGLWIVSEGGGDARMLTKPDSTTGELGHWWPQILPDGDHVLFTAYRIPLERATLEVLSIKSGERKVVLTGGAYGFYVPTGHLVYAAGETIRAVPFDLARLVVSGAPRTVVDDVAMNLTDGAAAFDVSESGTLAYMPVDSYVTETSVVLVDRKGNESAALPRKDRYNNPRLSPDGSRVSVDIRSADSTGDVWVFELGRSVGTRITAEDGREFGAEWTPDGRELIFSSERPFFDLYRRSADATHPAEPLLTGRYDHYTGSVSRDGSLFAFVLAAPGGELWTVPLQSAPAAARYLANGFNLGHPTLSPDGRWMAYDSDESGGVDVFIQSFPDPRGKRQKVSLGHGSEPMWTQGGRELVYREDDKVMAVAMDLASGASGPPRVLFAGPYPSNQGWTRPRSYDVSPDGQRFLMTKLPREQPRPRIRIVMNWFAELQQQVPTR
jgi:Tol biopolymer transport system component/tRNA A-37 threonylcarbamoyl transferase component Bud32